MVFQQSSWVSERSAVCEDWEKFRGNPDLFSAPPFAVFRGSLHTRRLKAAVRGVTCHPPICVPQSF